MRPHSRSHWNDLVAMALVTFAVLVYEIAVTRVLSVVLWYHFAFLTVSVAMLGLGASAAWLSLRPQRDRSLRHALLTAGLSIPLSICAILRGRPAILELGLGLPGFIGVVTGAMLVPMCSLGAAICLLLMSASGRSVARMYAADLFGAMLGAALVIPLMWWIATPRLLALLGLLPLASLALLERRPSRACIVGCGAILSAVIWGAPFELRYSKAHAEAGSLAPLYEVWTPTARIAVFDRPIFSPRPDVPWGWGYGARFLPTPTRELWIDQDGSAGTPVEHLDSKPEALSHLQFDVTSFGYQLVAPRKVCILGAGGGRDILTALAAGAREVDAVEFNSAIVDLLTGPLAQFSGDVYRLPGVRAVVDEGRSFLTRTHASYDLVQISLVDSWSATAAGAYALTENYLYTVEALRLYLRRLKPNGVLSISRWTDQVQPIEGARLILLAAEALRQEGVVAPRDHLLFVSGGWVGTLIVGKQPLDAATLKRADEIAERRGFVRHFPIRAANPRSSLASIVMNEGPEILTRAGLDVEPPVDDRPFFFQAARFFQLASDASEAAPKDVNLKSISVLRFALLLLAGLALGLFFAPFALFATPERGASFWSGSGYFALIGLGFMLLEMPWIERSVLFLGHPSYAAAVVLASLLLGASVGSALFAKLSPLACRRLFLLVPVVAAACSLAMAPLFEWALALSLAARISLSVMLFGGAGFFFGGAVPLGFMLFGERQKAWFWAINGAASVLASALSLALAMSFGFFVTAMLGCACYALAALLLWRRRPQVA